jgi:hypothetical protein
MAYMDIEAIDQSDYYRNLFSLYQKNYEDVVSSASDSLDIVQVAYFMMGQF